MDIHTSEWVRRQRGEGRIGFFIALVACAVLVFVGVRVVPVRVTAYEFREFIRQETRSAAVTKGDEKVAQRIMSRAEELEIPLTRKNLHVQRTQSEMVIRASYEQPVDLKFMTYVYRYSSEDRAPLF
jgi:hypothetical protein